MEQDKKITSRFVITLIVIPGIALLGILCSLIVTLFSRENLYFSLPYQAIRAISSFLERPGDFLKPGISFFMAVLLAFGFFAVCFAERMRCAKHRKLNSGACFYSICIALSSLLLFAGPFLLSLSGLFLAILPIFPFIIFLYLGVMFPVYSFYWFLFCLELSVGIGLFFYQRERRASALLPPQVKKESDA